MQAKLKSKDKFVLMADGSSKIRDKGTIVLDVEAANKRFQHEIHVMDIEYEGILGLDFMIKHDCQLDWKRGKICFDGVNVELHSQAIQNAVFRLSVKETTIVPPGSESIVAAQLVKTGRCHHAVKKDGMRNGYVSPLQSFHDRHDMVVAHALVDASQEVMPLRVFNPTENEVTLYKDSQPATVEFSIQILDDDTAPETRTPKSVGVIHTDDAADTESTTADQGQSSLPDHIQKLLDGAGCDLSDTQRNQAECFLMKFSELFSSGNSQLGRTNIVKHRINTGDNPPIKQCPRRIPIHKQAVADKEVEKMLQSGVVLPSKSPWASPIVLVTKKDGSTRFCVDYRKLNDATIKDAYPLPRIEDSLDSLGGSRWFSTLDLASGYWQVEVKEEDRAKTAFVTRKGLYEFTVMPFGLCNAPATFQRLMERVLAGLQWDVAVLYIDDIIVHGRTFEEHIERLSSVLQRLREANLTLKTKKCCLFQSKVEFLGHVVSGEGISPNPRKVKDVAEWVTPSTLTDLRSFLGLATYYRRFIEGFASIARPLHALTEKGKQFKWSDDCAEAFATLKNKLTSSPILAYPYDKDPFVLDTDASQFGIGAVLSQKQSGQELVISYGSRLLTKRERNYCTTRKELLAVVYFVRYFRHYLLGKPFLLRTDHGSLRWLFSFKEPEGQVARWIESLAPYEFKIEHRPGTKHLNADALSRKPCAQCGLSSSTDPGKNELSVKADVEAVTPHPENDGDTEKLPRISDVDHVPNSATDSMTIHTWSKEHHRKEQLKDRELKMFIEILESGRTRPSWEEISSEDAAVKFLWSRMEQLRIQENVLYLRWEDATGETVNYKLLVPKAMRKEVMGQLHDVRTAGHLGFNKTWSRAKRSPVYWRNMRRDIYEHCVQCHECGSRKSPTKKNRAPMQEYRIGIPMERVAMDVAGPFPETCRGNRFILVVSDYFTKWTEAYAMPNHTAETVANTFVEQFVCRFGTPREVFTDQGREFESRLFYCMCKELGIEKTRTSPFHPQSDGMVERFNRTMECMLTNYVSGNQRDWDVSLPFITMAYRSTEHDSTKFTPNMLMLGREVEMPLDIVVGLPLQEDFSGSYRENQAPHIGYAERLRYRLETSFEVVRTNLGKQMTRQKHHYDRGSKGTTRYQTGDSVWLYNPTRKIGLSPKLRPTWDGPYVVTKRLTDVTYRIRKNPRCKPKVVHSDRLKPYLGTHDKGWWKGQVPEEDTREEEPVTPRNTLEVPTPKTPSKTPPSDPGPKEKPPGRRYNLRPRFR